MKMKLSAVSAPRALMALLAPVAASAQDAAIYAYPTANYCPAGLQPVTIGGVICCGTPTRHQSYVSMMRHPVKERAHKVRKLRRDHIPAQKGILTGKGLGD